MKGLEDKDVLDGITERIFHFIEEEGLSYADFAASIDIGAAVVSHMKNGRNKVSLNVCAKILDSFPNLNPDWLLLDEGAMYRKKSTIQDTFAEQASLFSKKREHNTAQSAAVEPKMQEFEVLANSKQVKKIVIFFDDNSFQEFMP